MFDENNQLSLTQDPKISAAENMDIFPVEINSAPFIELIRVPGIGIKSARKIISIRKKMPFKNINELKNRFGFSAIKVVENPDLEYEKIKFEIKEENSCD